MMGISFLTRYRTLFISHGWTRIFTDFSECNASPMQRFFDVAKDYHHAERTRTMKILSLYCRNSLSPSTALGLKYSMFCLYRTHVNVEL